MTKHKDEQLQEIGEMAASISAKLPDLMGSVLVVDAEKIGQYIQDLSLQRLIDSGIVTATDSVITWREGHLEHVAALYVSDPARAWRDYADDLTVALAADGGNFAALVERARGNAE